MPDIKREKKIQDHDNLYAFLRHYVDFSLHMAYRKIKYIGLDRIPQDGAVIYAPNHTNALMDALIILAIDKKQKVFVARADIFKNPKTARILTWLKILPIMRIRDGIDEVRKNDVIFRKSVDVLEDKIPFCILPEGTHRAKHSLLPLSKGIFRIAMQAQREMKEGMPLYIVPVGLDYGNFFRFRSTVLIQIGEPINVKKMLQKLEGETDAEIMNHMKTELSEKMKETILFIPDDEEYDATYEICAATINGQVRNYLKEHKKSRKTSLTTRLAANQQTVSRIEKLREQYPEKAAELFQTAENAFRLRMEKKISLGSVIMKYPFWSRLLKIIVFLVTLPYTIPVSILTLPVTGLSAFLFTKMKDKAFFNSIRFVVTLILWPILLILYAIIAYSVLPWEWALCITLALIPGTVITQDAYRLGRLLISDLKLMFCRSLRNGYKEIRKLFYGKDR